MSAACPGPLVWFDLDDADSVLSLGVALLVHDIRTSPHADRDVISRSSVARAR